MMGGWKETVGRTTRAHTMACMPKPVTDGINDAPIYITVHLSPTTVAEFRRIVEESEVTK